MAGPELFVITEFLCFKIFCPQIQAQKEFVIPIVEI